MTDTKPMAKKRPFIPTIMISLVVCYITSYFVWSRFAMERARTTYGETHLFHYLPFRMQDPFIFERAVQIFYYPLNWLDQQATGAPRPGGEYTKSFSN
jgi:hypothetical protein